MSAKFSLGCLKDSKRFGRLQIREKDPSVALNKVHLKEDALSFLVSHGFIDAPFDIVDILAYLITKSANGVRLNLTKEYAELTKDSDSYADSMRERISYYIVKNLETIQKSLYINFGTDITDYFCGNKNFIQKVASIFATFDK